MERLIASIGRIADELKPKQQEVVCLPKDGIADSIVQLLDDEWFVKTVITETENEIVLLFER